MGGVQSCVATLAARPAVARKPSNSGGSSMPLQILLHYIATHGVADNYRGAIETIGGGQHVSHVVLNGASIERLFCLALTMPAQTNRRGTKTFVGEEVQEVLVPAPGAMPATMNT